MHIPIGGKTTAVGKRTVTAGIAMLWSFLVANKNVVSGLATVVTIIQSLTGTTICRDIIRKGSTGDISSLPLVAGALNGLFWLRYGLLVSDSAITVVNATSSTLFAAYTICFYLYAVRKPAIQLQVAGAVLAFASLLIWTHRMEHEQAVTTCGLLASAIAVANFTSPLANLIVVLKTKSTEVLPFPLIAANFTLTGLWWLYGLLINDTFVQIPNMMGYLLSSAQLFLFMVYPSSGAMTKSTSTEKLIA